MDRDLRKFGLSKELCDYVNGSDLSHQTRMYYVKNYVRGKLKRLENNDDIAQKLRFAGFNKAKAEELENIFKKNQSLSHQSLLYWVENYLDRQQHSEFELPEAYHTEKTNEWCLKRIGNRDIQLINITTKKVPHLTLDGVKIKLGEIWYHGAPIEDIVDFIEHGIDLEKGNYDQQFSRSNGFYIADNYQTSRDWACKKAAPDRGFGVLVFNFSVENLEGGLDLYNHGSNGYDGMIELVKKVIAYNKRVSNLDDDIDLKNAIKGAKFIYGPLLSDGAPLKSNQICIKDEHLAQSLDSTLFAVLVQEFTCFT